VLSNYYILWSSSHFLFAFLVWEYVRAELQPSCPLICLRGYGIVGTVPDLTETVELENSRAYSVLLLPDMPGVTFRTFQLDKSQVTKLQRSKVSWNPGNIEVYGGRHRCAVGCLLPHQLFGDCSNALHSEWRLWCNSEAHALRVTATEGLRVASGTRSLAWVTPYPGLPDDDDPSVASVGACRHATPPA
jgi:hypothetical protein